MPLRRDQRLALLAPLAAALAALAPPLAPAQMHGVPAPHYYPVLATAAALLLAPAAGPFAWSLGTDGGMRTAAPTTRTYLLLDRYARRPALLLCRIEISIVFTPCKLPSRCHHANLATVPHPVHAEGVLREQHSGFPGRHMCERPAHTKCK